MEAMERKACYEVDPADRVVRVDEGFAELAAGYGQPSLAQDALGRPLLDFVAGDRPRELQRALMARARSAAPDPLELRYRCDAPEMRRYGVLQLHGRTDGSLVFTTWFEATEDRPYQAVLDPDAPRDSDNTIALCAWCNRFRTDGTWHEAEAVIARSDARPPTLEHGLCEICELLLTTRPGAGPTRSGPFGRP
jgi:hypothetical protein